MKVTLNLFPYGRFPESNDLAPAGTEVEVNNQSEERDQQLRSSLGREGGPPASNPLKDETTVFTLGVERVSEPLI